LAVGSYQFAVKNKITKSRRLCSTIYGFAFYCQLQTDNFSYWQRPYMDSTHFATTID